MGIDVEACQEVASKFGVCPDIVRQIVEVALYTVVNRLQFIFAYRNILKVLIWTKTKIQADTLSRTGWLSTERFFNVKSQISTWRQINLRCSIWMFQKRYEIRKRSLPPTDKFVNKLSTLIPPKVDERSEASRQNILTHRGAQGAGGAFFSVFASHFYISQPNIKNLQKKESS